MGLYTVDTAMGACIHQFGGRMTSRRMCAWTTIGVLAMAVAVPGVAVAANSNSNGNGNGNGNGNSGSSGSDKVTICHATSSTTNPYVTITIATSGLNGHSGHAGDIIPAPASGCPTSTGGGSTDTGSTGTDTGTGSGSTGSTGGETGSGTDEKVTICHATGSAKNPYVSITIAKAALPAHTSHGEDLIPAPTTGCPKPPTGGPFACTAKSPVAAYASGPNAVTLRSCKGTSLRIWGDPWVSYMTPGMTAPQTFSVGYGSWSTTFGSTGLSWKTDPARRNAMSSLSIAGAGTAITIRPGAYPLAAGERRAALIPIGDEQLRAMRDQMLTCMGDTQQPIRCAAPAS